MTVTPVLASQKQLDRARGDGSAAAPAALSSSVEQLVMAPYAWSVGMGGVVRAGPLEAADPLAGSSGIRVAGEALGPAAAASSAGGLQQSVVDMAEEIAVVCLVSGLCAGSLLSWLWLLTY
jgi:hypothetical protein